MLHNGGYSELSIVMDKSHFGMWGLKRIHSQNNNLSSFHSKTHFVHMWNTNEDILSIHWKFMFKFKLICLWYTTLIYFQKVKIVLCLKNVGLCQCLYKSREQHDILLIWSCINARTSWRLRFLSSYWMRSVYASVIQRLNLIWDWMTACSTFNLFNIESHIQNIQELMD